jgi:hypothetical protein
MPPARRSPLLSSPHHVAARRHSSPPSLARPPSPPCAPSHSSSLPSAKVSARAYVRHRSRGGPQAAAGGAPCTALVLLELRRLGLLELPLELPSLRQGACAEIDPARPRAPRSASEQISRWPRRWGNTITPHGCIVWGKNQSGLLSSFPSHPRRTRHPALRPNHHPPRRRPPRLYWNRLPDPSCSYAGRSTT